MADIDDLLGFGGGGSGESVAAAPPAVTVGAGTAEVAPPPDPPAPMSDADLHSEPAPPEPITAPLQPTPPAISRRSAADSTSAAAAAAGSNNNLLYAVSYAPAPLGGLNQVGIGVGAPFNANANGGFQWIPNAQRTTAPTAAAAAAAPSPAPSPAPNAGSTAPAPTPSPAPLMLAAAPMLGRRAADAAGSDGNSIGSGSVIRTVALSQSSALPVASQASVASVAGGGALKRSHEQIESTIRSAAAAAAASEAHRDPKRARRIPGPAGRIIPKPVSAAGDDPLRGIFGGAAAGTDMIDLSFDLEDSEFRGGPWLALMNSLLEQPYPSLALPADVRRIAQLLHSSQQQRLAAAAAAAANSGQPPPQSLPTAFDVLQYSTAWAIQNWNQHKVCGSIASTAASAYSLLCFVVVRFRGSQ